MDTDHMPKKYHVYLVYSSPHPSIGMDGYSIVSILQSTIRTPMPKTYEYAIQKEPEKAIEEVFSIIANLKENKGLASIKVLEEVKDRGSN